MAAHHRGKVYTVAFIGVNGVGKSTSLAKVAYLLKNKGGLKVMIAGCDNFRSGAIEQLAVHARCLKILNGSLALRCKRYKQLVSTLKVAALLRTLISVAPSV